MTRLNPAKFVREVRTEWNRVTWPSRKEATLSTVMVLVLVAISSGFFLFIDWAISTLVRALLGI